MSNTLTDNINSILQDKKANLLPENLKAGVTCLGVTGTYTGDNAIYTVTFDSNGGSEIQPQKVVDGYCVAIPSVPIMEGGEFETWLLDGEVFDFSTPITSDITLTAKWITQLINYVFLYDSSLNNTQNWSEDTGGYNFKHTYSSSNGSLTKNKDNMYLICKYTSLVKNSYISIAITNNMINFQDYKLLCSRSDVYLDGNGLHTYLGARSVNSFPDSYSSSYTGDNVSIDTNNSRFAATARYTTKSNLLLDNNIENSGRGYVYYTLQAGINKDSNATIRDMFMVKQDNWEELCTTAGLTSSDYTDEAALCANSEAISAILKNEAAVKYMLKKCTGTFMYNFIRNTGNNSLLLASPYYDTIQANEHWSKFLKMLV